MSDGLLMLLTVLVAVFLGTLVIILDYFVPTKVKKYENEEEARKAIDQARASNVRRHRSYIRPKDNMK